MSGATRTIRLRLGYRQQMMAWFAATQSLFLNASVSSY